KLAPRYEHFLSLSQRIEDQKKRGGIVVYDQRTFYGKKARQKSLQMAVAVSAFSLRQVELKIAVARQIRDALHSGGCQRRAPKIRVNDNPGGVDDSSQGGLSYPFQPLSNAVKKLSFCRRRFPLSLHSRARIIKHTANCL